jgi:hypothetical protein
MALKQREAHQLGAGEMELCTCIATLNPLYGGWHAAVS